MTEKRTISVPDDARRAVLLVAALFLIYNLNLRAIGAGDTLYVQYAALSIAAGVTLVLAPLGLYHTLVFGTPVGGLAMLHSADTHAQWHGIDGPFSAALLQGLSGVLLSPSRGLLVYTPIVVVSVVGAALVWRTAAIERWTLIIPGIGFILLWSSFVVWWGGHSFGPRFAADLVIPMAILAAAACAQDAWRLRSQWATSLTVLLLLWSVSVQVTGSFFHPNGDWNIIPVNVDVAHNRLWDWRDPQILQTIKAGPFVDHLEPLKGEITR